jgi:hypothetical protein
MSMSEYLKSIGQSTIVRICIAIAVVLICGFFKPMTESFELWDHPTRCFDCEKNLPDNIKYIGQKTKCFSCEKDIISRGGNGDDVHPIRYYNGMGSGHAGIAKIGRPLEL